MTWQDELQNLDAELAAGRISAEEYRQRRDSVLGRAQGGAPQSPIGGTPMQQQSSPSPSSQQSGQQQQGPGPQSQPNPFPPAFSWSNTVPPNTPQNRPPANAGTPSGGFPQQQPPADMNSTQIMSVPLPPQPQWGQPQQPWASQQDWTGHTGTPWGDELPAHGDAAWMRQGPDAFDIEKKSGKGKLIAGISVAAVLVVVVIVAGVFYFLTAGGDETAPETTAAPPPPVQQAPQLPEPPAPLGPPASPQEVLVPVAGPPHPWNGMLDVPSLQGPKSGILPKAVLDTAFQNGLTDGWFTATDGTATPKTSLIALRMPDENAAKTVSDRYIAAQQGLSNVPELSYQGVEVLSTGGTFRTSYVAHGYVVIMEVSAPAEQKTLSAEAFRATLAQQLTRTPPTVRQ